ncbi:hypothetical protein J2Z30_000308 [Streptomyces iranensis]|uniref:Uncharacterized protein n=1 Tax=Streptomyces iranensis TaxID=576784 RepID=A0ABS4MIZ4_9ACTN|nr:hypothetical protein [Streptomyces iranensis]
MAMVLMRSALRVLMLPHVRTPSGDRGFVDHCQRYTP